MNPPAQHDAAAITGSGGSNLALAFVSLPKDRRDDMRVLYAFCRVVDDIADDPTGPPEGRRQALGVWKNALTEKSSGESPLAPAVRDLMRRRAIPPTLLAEIIDGVAMDLEPVRYATFGDLREYCYKVASAVGLASIEIFGYRDPATRDYAVHLGLALQLTNILRDVGRDYANGGRIYLPGEDMEKFGVTEQAIAEGRRDGPFLQLMEFEARRAEACYMAAAECLPARDASAMVAAEIMRGIYHALLVKIRRDGFRVFERSYRLGRIRKIAIILAARLRARIKNPDFGD